MTTLDLSRRRFLRGLGGSALALPLLNAGLPGLAHAEPENSSNGKYPKRLLIFFHPNGVIPSGWWPKRNSEKDFELRGSLTPLKPFKDRLLFMKGVHMKSVEAGPGEPHQQGMGGVLTGHPLQQGNMVGGDGSKAGWGDGISIDQAIADEIGQNTPFKSLELGVRASAYGGSEVRTRMCYAGPAQPLAPQDDPRKVFDQLFKDFQADPNAQSKLQAKQSSILDTVHKQFERVKGKVGKRDRRKLEQHAAKVRDLERRLKEKPSSKDSCKKPNRPPDHNPDSEKTMPEIMDLQCDLAVMALACDLTRVVSIQIANAMNAHRYPWVDSTKSGHQLSHAGPSNTQAHQEWIARDKWHAQKFAKLLGKLDSIPEGDGTMLDNTALLWINELSKGNTHSHDDMPFILAGNVGDQFETGRFVEYQSGKYHNDLLAALGKAYGLETDTFGDKRFSNGPLAALT